MSISISRHFKKIFHRQQPLGSHRIRPLARFRFGHTLAQDMDRRIHFPTLALRHNHPE